MKSIAVMLACACTLLSYAQKEPLKDFYLKRSLKQEGLQFTFSVLDEDKRGVLFHSKKKFYFWYKAQHVLSTQGGSSGILLHDDFEAFYPNKQLARKGDFNRGLKQGEWLYWREDGTLLKAEQWSRGKQVGKQVFYDTDGNPSETRYFKSMRKEVHVEDTVTVIRNNNRKCVSIYENGQLSKINRYKNERLHGIQKEFDASGIVSKEKYKNGELISSPETEEVENQDQAEQKERFVWLKKLFTKKKTPKEEKEKTKEQKKEKKKARDAE